MSPPLRSSTRSKPGRVTTSGVAPATWIWPWVPKDRLLPTSSKPPARTVKLPAPTVAASPNSTRGRVRPLVAKYLPGPDRRTYGADSITRLSAASAPVARENAPA
ncbi:Uncharacterised protein [Achromobacter xylosoxidans]|nr:Uncharacterised protein [Achromobacter xylosoxidans]